MKFDKIFKIYFQKDHKNKFQLIDQLYNMIGKLKTFRIHMD
jgi:hypothetical protein